MAAAYLHGVWLGRTRYGASAALQNRLHELRRQGACPDIVLLLEHEPVITLGRGAHENHILLPREVLEARGFEVAETRRGGDVTLHAPGQLVAYPIVHLEAYGKDVRKYVSTLRETMRRVAAAYGVNGGEVPGHVGLWVDAAQWSRWPGAAEQAAELKKLGAIGVRISRWVTQHGFALNLTTDLSLFQTIVPCGIRQWGVTSIEELTGHGPTVYEAAELALGHLGELWQSQTELHGAAWLNGLLARRSAGSGEDHTVSQ